MKSEEQAPGCFCIHSGDNVATMLADAEPGTGVQVLGEGSVKKMYAAEPVRIGHKIALAVIHAGAPVVKYGFPIGQATQTIEAGAWVHLHNCRSLYDAQSSELDLDSGSRTGTRYA